MSEQRLIDANAFDNRVRVAGGFAEEELSDDFKDGVLAVLEMLKRQPTIEERKTGKWVRHYSRPNVYADLCWHCSNCGYKTPDNWANKWKFCPNCGARMVQEGEEP